MVCTLFLLRTRTAVADVANVAGIAVSKCTSMAEAQLISCRASPKSQRRLLPFAALNEKDRQKENDMPFGPLSINKYPYFLVQKGH